MPLENWINPGPQQQRSAQDNEINNYSLVGNKGWMTYCKLLVGTLLATWNFNLFINTITGRMGIFTAFVAISLEVTALYCVHNYPRSIGNHQKWLGRFAVLLGLFSLAHAVFAIVHYTGYAGDTSFVVFYSHVIALPLIVVLLSVTTATLVMTHPSAAIIKELAASKIQSLKNRAHVLMERNRLLDAQELARLKAQLFEEETAMKVELIPIVRRRIEANQELEELINAIDDIDSRRQIRNDIAALTSRQSAASPTTTTTLPQVSPHARQTVLGLGQGYAVNGGGQNGHP